MTGSQATYAITPLVSIVIRSKNEERFIGQTLESISRQSVPYGFEIILVDSGSTDRTIDIAAAFGVRLIEIDPKTFTFGSALNTGAHSARGKIVINLSAHCIPTSETWMRDLVAPLVENRTSATFGKQEPIKGLNPFEEPVLESGFSATDSDTSQVAFSNSNAAIRKEVLIAHPFDEKASFAEDFIWAKTLPTQHKIQYVPSASVFHSHPLTFRYWKKRFYDNGVADQYLKLVYDLRWPWQEASQEGNQSNVGKIMRTLRGTLNEVTDISRFLIKRRYFLYVLLAPVFVLMRKHYYHKGLKTGLRLYAQNRAIDLGN